jgi:GNAT superfamily N-acetyltransferase
MEELASLADLAEACGNDAHCMWAGQGLSAGGRIWVQGGAVAVACPALSGQDRLVIQGPHDAVIELVRGVVPMVTGGYILVGDAELITMVTAAAPSLAPRNQFGWMDTVVMPSNGRSHRVRWLCAEEWPEVADLLSETFPDSYARPAVPGVQRWAGIRDGSGSLASTAADAWSAPTVGFLAGVCVSESARGKGLGRDACHFVLEDLLAVYGRAALMVHTWNTAAIRTYCGLGMSWRLLGSAWIGGPALMNARRRAVPRPVVIA